MSRGMHLGYPKSVSFTNFIRTFAYDGAAFIWAIESENASSYVNTEKVCTLHALSWHADHLADGTLKAESLWAIQKRKSYSLPITKDLYIPQNMVILNGKIYFSLNKVVKSENYSTPELFQIALGDTPDGFDSESFSQIGVFDIASKLYTEILTPVVMKSNISVVGDSLYFGKKWIEDDINDLPSLYRYNTISGTWDSCVMSGVKKQRERINTFSTFKNTKLFVPLWNDFKVAIIDTTTFSLINAIPANGYPTAGIYTDEDKAFFTSFAGMMTQLNVDTNASSSELGTGGVGKNLRNTLAFEHGTTKIWYAKENDFGRIDTSNKEVISVKDEGKDFGILKVSGNNTFTSIYNVAYPYNVNYLDLPNTYDFEVISTPKFVMTYINTNNAQQQMTIHSRIFIKLDKRILMFNSRDVEFVFDYIMPVQPVYVPNSSYVSSHMIVGGNAMVGSGDTDYIGEFFI